MLGEYAIGGDCIDGQDFAGAGGGQRFLTMAMDVVPRYTVVMDTVPRYEIIMADAGDSEDN